MPMEVAPRSAHLGPAHPKRVVTRRSAQAPCRAAVAPDTPTHLPAPALRRPVWKSRDYTQAAKLALPVSRHDLGPACMPFPAKYGVELEMDGPSLQDARSGVAEALGGACQGRSQGVTDTHGRLWQVKPDEGSLVEVASPVLGGLEGLREVQTIASNMKRRGAVAHELTGTHFHVDARSMDVPHMLRLMALLARHESHLYRALGVHRGRVPYCLPMERGNVVKLLENPPASLVDLCKTYRGEEAERNRGLNVENLLNRSSQVTLEFRYFNGTLNAHLIGCYAGLVMGLTHYAMASEHIPNRREVLGQPSLPTLLGQIDMPPTHPVSTLLVGRMLATQ